MEAVGQLGGIDLELEHCFAELMSSLIGQISMRTFHDGGIAGFCYENPANELSDDENFVRARVSDDDGVLSGDGESDDGGDCLTNDEGSDDNRGHDDDDHDIHGNFYHLHGDEGNVGGRSRNGDNHVSHGSICHLCIGVRSDESHGHNDDDHDPGMGDDDEENDRDENLMRVSIDHGHYRQHA